MTRAANITRQFDLSDILALLDGAYVDEIEDYMTSWRLNRLGHQQTHPRCVDGVLLQHEELRTVVRPSYFHDKDTYEAWLAEQEARFGAKLPLRPLSD